MCLDLPAVLSLKNRPNHYSLRFSHFSHNTLFVGLLFFIPARAHRHKGRKLRFQEAKRRRHTGLLFIVEPPIYILNRCILSIYILNRYIFVFDLPAVLSFKNRPNHHALRFSHFSHNTLFVGLLFYIPARAHRQKGRKLHSQEAQRRRHTDCCRHGCYSYPPFIY